MAIETEQVPASTGVGSPFNFDAGAFIQDRTPSQPIDVDPIGSSDLLDQAIEVTSGLLRGELPPDVAEQIKLQSAEAGIQRGVRGQMGRNLVARDLGLTSLQLQQSGLQATPALAQLEFGREEFNRNLELSVSQFNQSIREWEDKFAATLNQSDQTSAGIALQALDLQSRNRQFRIAQENQLIIQNSVSEIEGLQGNLDSMRSLFDNFNRQLQGLTNVFS